MDGTVCFLRWPAGGVIYCTVLLLVLDDSDEVSEEGRI
jgi:hypothetical protein